MCPVAPQGLFNKETAGVTQVKKAAEHKPDQTGSLQMQRLTCLILQREWNSLKNNVVRVWNSSGRKAYFSSIFPETKALGHEKVCVVHSWACTTNGIDFPLWETKKQYCHVSVKPPLVLWWWYRKPTKIDLSVHMLQKDEEESALKRVKKVRLAGQGESGNSAVFTSWLDSETPSLQSLPWTPHLKS